MELNDPNSTDQTDPNSNDQTDSNSTDQTNPNSTDSNESDILDSNIFNETTYVPLVYTPNYNCTNILLIDNAVKDYQTIADSVNSNTMAIVYSYLSTKEDLSMILMNFTNISRIAFAFYSNSNNYPVIFLDNQPLFSFENSIVDNNSENVLFLINLIQKYNVKNIDYLACSTLNYPQWENYYNILKNVIVEETNDEEIYVIVGASNDKTGNIKYGGDWILENTLENIENIYFTQNINYYTYLLDNPNFIAFTGINMAASTPGFYGLGLLNQIGNANLNGQLIMTSVNSVGGLLTVNTGSNSANPTGATNWQYYYTNYATYGMIQLFSPTSNLYYLYIARSGSIMRLSNFRNVVAGYTSATLCSIASLYVNTGIVSYIDPNNSGTNKYYLYVSSTLGIYQVQITDSASPTASTPILWATNAQINAILTCGASCVYGLAIIGNKIYAMIKNQGIVSIIINSNNTLGTISLFSNNSLILSGASLLGYNNIIYCATQNSLSASTTTYGTGNIYKISMAGRIYIHVSSTYCPANTGLATDGTNLYMLCAGTTGTSQKSYISIYSFSIPLLENNFFNNITDITSKFIAISQLSSLPTFNGTSNFATNFRIKQGGNDVDLALLYELNTVPIAKTYTTGMFGYSNGTKYDLSYFFANPSFTPSFVLNTPTSSYIINNGLYYSILGQSSNTTATFTVTNGPLNITILAIGPGGNGGTAGTTGASGASGGGGGGLYYSNIILQNSTYTVTAGSPGNATTFTSSSGNSITANSGSNGTTSTASNNRSSGGTCVNSGFSLVSGTSEISFTGGQSGRNILVPTSSRAYPGFSIPSNAVNYSNFINNTSITNIGTTSYTYLGSNGSTINTALGNNISRNSLNSSFGTSTIKISSNAGTNGSIQTTSSTAYGWINGFCSGGGGGNNLQTTTFGGGSGGSYDIGGTYNYGEYPGTGNADNSGAGNGGPGKQWGCGGGGSSSNSTKIGGSGAPGAVFIYVG